MGCFENGEALKNLSGITCIVSQNERKVCDVTAPIQGGCRANLKEGQLVGSW